MWEWLFVALIGGFVGVGELVSRYKDSPWSALRLISSWLYVAINAAASLIGLHLVRTFGWKFGGTTETQVLLWQVLVAGFSAMALLRSSLFTVRVGETDVGVGPSAMLTALLTAADRGIDRVRAAARLKAARTEADKFLFTESADALVNNVLSALQNLPAEEAKSLATAAGALKSLGASERQKGIALGLLLLDVCGEDLLREAVASLDPAQPSEKV